MPFRTLTSAIQEPEFHRICPRGRFWLGLCVAWLACGLGSGCGTTKQYEATAQLLASDAVDMAVAKLDFTPLNGEKVFLDTQYLRDHKNVGFVNAQYVISSIRQQMLADGVLLFDDKNEAELIVEARLGTLGTDENEVVYGIPPTNITGAASGVISAVTQSPVTPGIPELSIARRRDQMSAVKLGLFAYDSKTRDPVWQSGLSMARATAKDFWFMGVGPFQRGTIHDGSTRFAGTKMKIQLPGEENRWVGDIAEYRRPHMYKDLSPPPEPGRVELAENAEPLSESPEAVAETSEKQGDEEAKVVPAKAEESAAEKPKSN